MTPLRLSDQQCKQAIPPQISLTRVEQVRRRRIRAVIE
jgi:hypothetical protein